MFLNRRRHGHAFSLVLLGLLGCAPEEAPVSVEAASIWPRFRGPNGAGLSDSGRIPERFGPGVGVVWERELPPGRSSPVLSATRIFLTAVEDDSLVTLCLDRESGELVWRATVPRRREAPHSEHNSPASATPAIDEDTVVAFFQDFGLVAYDHDGGERWRKELGPHLTRDDYGLAASPILEDGIVVQVLDDLERSTLLALREEDGEPLWTVDRPAIGCSWSTPVVHRPGEGPVELVHAGAFVLECFALETGERLRWVRGTFVEPIGGATIREGVAYLVGYGPLEGPVPKVKLIEGTDEDGDGLLSPSEIPAWHRDSRRLEFLFLLADANGDGGLDESESLVLKRSFQHYLKSASGLRRVLAIELEGRGDVTETTYRWAARASGCPEVALPLVTRESVFIISDTGGVMSRFDRGTGVAGEPRRIEGLEEWCFTSPVAAGGRMLLLSHEGSGVVIGLEGEPVVLGRVELGERCYATPALGDGRMYLRTVNRLYCFGSGGG